MKKLILFFSLLLCCSLTFSQSIFLDAGSSVPADAAEGQPVLSYAFGIPDANGNFHDINLSLVTGAMTQELFTATAAGTSFNKMEIKFYDEQKKIYYKITLQDVMIMSMQTGSDLVDHVNLSFSKIKIKEFGH